MNPRAILLLWIERTLIAVGAALAIWCAVAIGEARYYRALPIPRPAAAAGRTTLPGESPGDRAHPRAALAVGAWVARLEAPSVDLAATVLEGSDEETLIRAAGHIEATALPGEPGNIGIAAHRDTIFRPVRRLRAGDPLVLTTSDRVYRYRVTGTRIVEPDDVSVLNPSERPTLTLVTCYPFSFIGHAPQRFIVSADLVEQERR
jgi:sortase A